MDRTEALKKWSELHPGMNGSKKSTADLLKEIARKQQTQPALPNEPNVPTEESKPRTFRGGNFAESRELRNREIAAMLYDSQQLTHNKGGEVLSVEVESTPSEAGNFDDGRFIVRAAPKAFSSYVGREYYGMRGFRTMSRDFGGTPGHPRKGTWCPVKFFGLGSDSRMRSESRTAYSGKLNTASGGVSVRLYLEQGAAVFEGATTLTADDGSVIKMSVLAEPDAQ